MFHSNRKPTLVKYNSDNSLEISTRIANIPVFVPVRDGHTLNDFAYAGTFGQLFGQFEPPPVRTLSTVRGTTRYVVLHTRLVIAHRPGVFNVKLCRYKRGLSVLPSGGLRDGDSQIMDLAVDAAWVAWQSFAPILANQLLNDPDIDPDRAWSMVRSRTPVYHLPTTATSRERTAYKKTLAEVEK